MSSIVRRGLRFAARKLRLTSNSAQTSNGANGQKSLPITGEFIDRHGNRIPVYSGYRDLLKPNWRSMFGAPQTELTEAQKNPQTAESFRSSVNQLEHFLRIHGFQLQGKRVLEIGCHLGERAFALAAYKECDVTALYLPDYYVQQIPGKLPPTGRHTVEVDRLSTLQKSIGEVFVQAGADRKRIQSVRFRGVDFLTLDEADASFDLIVSWETLEHIRDCELAFREMRRLLKPGGLAFHEYDPYFNIEGGHSLCTLEFPYSHVRLNTEDFHRWLELHRPQELDVAYRYYQYNLNRMTLADLREYVSRSGLKLLEQIPWNRQRDLPEIDDLTLRQVQANYPTATLQDLLAHRAWVLLRNG